MSPERAGSPLALEPRELALALQSAVPPFQLVRLQLSQTMQTPSSQSSIAQNTPIQQSPQQDDDLTSLTWLQDNNLLKGMNLTCVKAESDGINTKQMDITSSSNLNNNQMSVLKTNSNFADQSPTSDYMDESSVSEPTDSSSSSLNSPIPYTQSSKSNAKHPHNMRYDPMVHTFSKPPYSFSCLIFMAIEDSPAKALPVKDIYAWILDHFPYFKNAPTGWKNSVRHNLSLNKCFQKVEKSPNLGKGSLWMVDQQYRPNLLQALTRSPFHPCSTLDPSTFRSSSTRTSSPFVQQIIDSTKPSTRLPNPELFPYLSRRLAASEGNYDMKIGTLRSEDESSLDDVDAATAILALKHGSRIINIEEKKRRISTRSLNTCIIPSELVQVITRSPSEDHTYSVADNIELQDQRSSSPDEAFESDDSHSRSNFSSLDLEEQRRIEEGADALLNLAGITTLPKKTSNDIFSYAVPSKRKRCHDQNTSLSVMEQSSISVKSSDQNFSPRMLRAKRKPDGLLHNHLKRKNVINNNNNNNNFDKRSHKTVTSKNEIRIYEKNIRFTQR